MKARRDKVPTARDIMMDAQSAQPDDRVEEVLGRLRGRGGQSNTLMIQDRSMRLLGCVPFASLVASSPEQTMKSIMAAPAPSVNVERRRDRIAHEALHAGAADLAVTDSSGKLVGVIPAHTLMTILYQEHVEDIHRLAGIGREDTMARHAIEAPPMRQAKDRMPWILVGWVGSTAASWLISRYEGILSTHVALAFFMPGLVYLADALGTQTEAIAVRGLSLSRVPFRRLLMEEVRTGLFIGILLATITLPLIWLFFHNLSLAMTVSLALIFASTVATAIGLFLPWVLSRLGTDPAYGSGPLATILQDILSLMIYFGLAGLLLG